MKILLVDDDPISSNALYDYLLSKGYKTNTAATAKECFEKLQSEEFDVLLLDFVLPDKSGLEILNELAKNTRYNDLTKIMITGFGSIKTAVEAMKKGAYDFITKPIDLKYLIQLLKRIEKEKKIIEERNMYIEHLSNINIDIVQAKSRTMNQVWELAKQIAVSDSPVLLTGETGVGKDIVARYIHAKSKRSNRPFVPINCAAIPKDLIEAELFGSEKGSFTGAIQRKRGKFEIANNGTLFLDEIGELDVSLQSKLLRVIEDGTFYRIGGSELVKTNVRIVAATNRDLKKLLANGKFREDLYYRISTFHIDIPPLRQRKEDIPVFLNYFIDMIARKYNKKTPKFNEEDYNLLCDYSWPGNVRELKAFCERLIVLSYHNEIKEKINNILDLDTKEANTNYSVKFIVRKHILDVYNKTGKNKLQTARLLQISRRTLHNKLKEYGVD